MKKIIGKISLFFLVLTGFFFPTKVKGANKADISKRINKIRVKVKSEVEKGNILELTGKDFTDKTIKGWVNWGNWNNWNNWKNWNNWANWRNV